uniref:Ovule protein n=1 Tax=Ascaris lumbricoides TaxID=6252 RepID=A0A0M3IFD1_ASCLU
MFDTDRQCPKNLCKCHCLNNFRSMIIMPNYRLIKSKSDLKNVWCSFNFPSEILLISLFAYNTCNFHTFFKI